MPVDGAYVDFHQDAEIRRGGRLDEQQFDAGIFIAARSVPIDHNAVDAATDHVLHLAMYLRRVLRTVADVDMAGAAPPWFHMGIDFGRRAGIKKRADGEL